MTNGPFYFEIQADNPQRAIKFYGAVFGWAFTEVKGLPLAYWQIDTKGLKGGLMRRPAKAPPPQCGTNAFTCSMEADDFDAVAKKILAQGGSIALPKFPVPGKCWQGYFLDPEGNTFGLFQVDLTAGL